jgi:hypothetical protein
MKRDCALAHRGAAIEGGAIDRVASPKFLKSHSLVFAHFCLLRRSDGGTFWVALATIF